MADVVIQAQSTLFHRDGHQLQNRYNELPSLFPDFMDWTVTTTPVPLDSVTKEYTELTTLVNQNPTVIGGGTTLFNVQNTKISDLPGQNTLLSIYSQDPFSVEYENETEALYERSFDIARARSRSGPANVRGGTARTAFESAELDLQMSLNRFKEIWQNQVTVSQMVTSAVQVASAAQAQLRSAWLQSQQQQAATEHGKAQEKLAAADQLNKDRESHLKACSLVAEVRGKPHMDSFEYYDGWGFQGATNTGFGYAIQR